ncbi:hypothetical protein [Hugenholtzia roseola]|uniref:hypothetical protein n=1 Tax=Hugenholtzia roseola TaxID=1002 RepID=UPI0012B54A50|nr:hypothetical protein [Hugenholtzia roseola]
MKKNFIFALGFSSLLLVACGKKADSTTTASADSVATAQVENATDNATSKMAENAATQETAQEYDLVLNYDKADLHESIKIKKIDEKTIRYEVYLSSGECPETTISGTATLKEGDAESDEDAEGNAYFVDEYTDDKAQPCSVSLRIGSEEKPIKGRFQLYTCHHFACGESYDSQVMTASK